MFAHTLWFCLIPLNYSGSGQCSVDTVTHNHILLLHVVV